MEIKNDLKCWFLTFLCHLLTQRWHLGVTFPLAVRPSVRLSGHTNGGILGSTCWVIRLRTLLAHSEKIILGSTFFALLGTFLKKEIPNIGPNVGESVCPLVRPSVRIFVCLKGMPFKLYICHVLWPNSCYTYNVYFFTKTYIWPLIRIVSSRRFQQVVKHRIWWRNNARSVNCS